MSLPKNISKEHLLAAISKIDKEGIPKDADSQYYDVIYNGKKYPPKVIVSFANIFANGDPLDRNSFSGGMDTESFNLLKKYGFVIEKKSNININQPKVWFVTQGATYTADKGMTFLWAPVKGKDNRQHFYWDNVSKVKKGDIIFNYSAGFLKGVSVATSDGYPAINADTNSQWGNEGFRVDIELTPLDPIISGAQLANQKAKLDTYLSPISNKPFNTNGGVNQGYLFEFTKEAGRLIRDIYGKLFGNKIIDDFLDEVKFKKIMDFDHKAFYEKGLSVNFFISERLSCRFIASLLTKPFVILTGLSGSGKTKLAQAFATWICENENQYCIVPVGADWTNREPLLGFPNALQPEKYVKPDNRVLDLILAANTNPDKPYFLILDEMNLSHVERYFADFLSVMESNGKISLHTGTVNWNDIPTEMNLPQNLFIIGTVNIDETTYMFSPKVLDRASVIEFRVTADEMNNYLSTTTTLNLENLKSAGAIMAKAFVEIAKDKSLHTNNAEILKITLLNFFNELKKTGAEFGYRSASEISRFAAVVNSIEPSWSMIEIIDAAIMQKLLPKVHGSRRRLEPVLKTLAILCLVDGQNIDEFISSIPQIDFSDARKIKYPLSLEKILRMYHGLIDNGFTSYAEA